MEFSVHAAVNFPAASSTLPRVHSLVNQVTHCRFVAEHWKNILFADEQEHRRAVAEEALINAAMGSFAAKANVFLVKAASHSGGRERMA